MTCVGPLKFWECPNSPNDTSVGDLDGDGEYELIVKWDPSNSKDNSQSGYTGPVYLDAYTLAGTRLWRIDLGATSAQAHTRSSSSTIWTATAARRSLAGPPMERSTVLAM